MTYVDGMAAIISNGNGFWGPPVRMGPYPEIVVINVKKAGAFCTQKSLQK